MKNIYETVTNQIIEALEKVESGAWDCPWSGGLPANASTGAFYRGLNILLLMIAAKDRGFTSNQWVTFKQAKAIGGQVRKGEKGTKIIFFRMVEKKDSEKPEDEEKDTFPVARFYTVFNVEQCDGLSEVEQGEPPNPIAEIEDFLGDLDFELNAADAFNPHACYIPETDVIVMPELSLFKESERFYAVLFHEMAHRTGHKSRLNRDLSGRFGDERYAAEELIAEFTSAFLSARFGICSIIKHAEYIASWKRLLTADPYAVATCAKKAMEATEYLLNEATNKPTAVSTVTTI